jgi:hypothetical protein
MQARQARGDETFRASLGGITACQTCGPNPDVRRQPVKKKRHSLPKIAPLPGTLREEYRGCGKPNCRCVRGDHHGPYLYRRWREGGRQRRSYIKPAAAAQVEEALDEWRRLHPPARSMRSLLADLRRLTPRLDSEED